MAKVTAPLFSFTARGQLAKSLVFMNWKGIADVRQHVVPSNPKTTGQTTQRGYMSTIVAVYKATFTNAAMRTAWNLTAQIGSTVQSGFNAFVSAAVQVLQTIATSSFAMSAAAASGRTAVFTMKNLSDGSTGTETGNFTVWAGSTSSNLVSVGTAAIAAGTVTTAALGTTPGETIYVKLVKNDAASPAKAYDRSGICKIISIA